MGWLIAGFLLAVLGGLALLTRRARRHPAADDTLIAELLGPSTGQRLPDPPAPSAAEPPPAPAVQPADEGDWLETQLASIAAWSERMQAQIASAADGPDLPPVKPEPAAVSGPAHASHPADHEPREPPQPRRAPGHCMATTAKGGQCKRPARPGATTCAIHARR